MLTAKFETENCLARSLTTIVFPHLSSPNGVNASCSDFVDCLVVSVASGISTAAVDLYLTLPPLQREELLTGQR